MIINIIYESHSQQGYKMTKNPYQQASQAYGQIDKDSLNGFQITAKLYEGIMKNLHEAKRLYESNSLEEMIAVNTNTFDILGALQSTLNAEDEEAQEYSDYLYRYYNITFIKLAEVLEREDPSAEYDDIINFFRPLYQRWQDISEESIKDPEAVGLSPASQEQDPAKVEPIDIQE